MLVPEELHHNFLPVGSTVPSVTLEVVPPRFHACGSPRQHQQPHKPETPSSLIIYSITLEAWPLNRQGCFLSSSISCSACGDIVGKRELTALKSEQPLYHTERDALWELNPIIHSFIQHITE